MAHRYSFNDGTAVDNVGGAAFSATLMGSPGVVGGKVALQSSGQFVSLPATNLAGVTALSIEMWVDTGANVDSAPLIAWGDSLSNLNSWIVASRSAAAVSAVWRLSGAPVCGPVSSTHAFDGQTGMHVVLTVAAGSLKLYVNGMLAGSSSCAGSALPPVNYFYSGSSPAGTLVGSVNEFRVWTGALSAVDVAAHYSQGPGEPLFG